MWLWLIMRAIRSEKKGAPEGGVQLRPFVGNKPPVVAMKPYRERSVIDVGGVEVHVHEVAPSVYEQWSFAQVAARTLTRAPRLLWSHDWSATIVPSAANQLLQFTRIDERSRGDTIAASALPALRSVLAPLMREGVRVVIASNDLEIVAWLDEPPSPAVIELAIAAVAALARWDAALAFALAALPDATLLADPALSPAVTLAPDGLRVGVRAGGLIAELDGVARTVDREPARLLADVVALRADVARSGPYR
jgi:hypothetical protein